MPPQIQILILPQPPDVLLRLIGEIRFDTDDCEKYFQEALSSNPRSALVDCSQLDFISSCGMKLLVTLRNHLHHRAGAVTLQNLKPHLAIAFRHAKLTELFTFTPPL